MADVFISYKRRLRPRVERLAEALAALDIDVWFDAALDPGKSFSGEISQEVRTASCVLVCWSDDAFPHGGDENGWVIGEATIGRNRKVLVALTLEPTDFDPPWNVVHAEDLTGWSGRREDLAGIAGWPRVLAAVGRHIGRSGLPEYERAFSAGTSDALALWLGDFPGDPYAPTVRRALDERRRVESQLKTMIDAPASPPAAIDLNGMEAALTALGELSNDADSEAARRERDAALSEDLSYERARLEEAVSSALSDAATAPTAPPAESGAPAARRNAMALPAPAVVLLASGLGTLLSTGLFFLSQRFGLADTGAGNVIAVAICPALFAAAIVSAALFQGRIDVARAVLVTVLCPLIAVFAGACAAGASGLISRDYPTWAMAFFGSVIGAAGLFSVMSASGVVSRASLRIALVGSLAVAAAVTAAAVAFKLNVGIAGDAMLIMLAWELAFSLLLAAHSWARNRSGPSR